MSQAGATAVRDLRSAVEQRAQIRHQENQQLAGLKLEVHQRAVSATTKFTAEGGGEPATPEAQMEYAKQLYAWVTEDLTPLLDGE